MPLLNAGKVLIVDDSEPSLHGLGQLLKRAQYSVLTATPVVLISADLERETRLAGLESGADDAVSLFLALGRIVEARDPCTEGHCERLAEYATALGRRLNVDRPGLDALYRGAFLHDVGKIAIPDRVLLKKGRLTRKEYELMKRHPAIGDDLCSTVRFFESVRPLVRHHHERLDGCGYPDGLVGDQVPLLAQIVSIVDVFDALTTNRPYRKALATSTAYRIMRDDARGGWCREELVETFIDLRRASEIAGA